MISTHAPVRLTTSLNWPTCNSNLICPVRPPQTAIGRTAGTLLGSAPVPVAVFGNPKGIESYSPALTVRAGQARSGYAGFSAQTIINPERVESPGGLEFGERYLWD